MTAPFQEILGAHVLSCSRRLKVHASYEKTGILPGREKAFHLIYLTGGRGVFRFVDRTVTVRAGDTLLWEARELLDRTARPGMPLSYWLILFVPLGSGGILNLKETGLPRICTLKNRPAFLKAFAKLIALFSAKEPGWEQACSMLTLKILQSIIPASQAVHVDALGPDNRIPEKRIGDVIDFINRNYKKRLGVHQLARVAKVHPAHLTRLFKRATGFTPHRYILNRKIEKAKDFILHFRQSPTTTAMELGFHDYPHFTRVFSRLAGLSPKQFLKKEKAKS